MKPSLRSKPISIFELKRSPTAVFEASECDAVAVYNRGALIGYVVPTQTYEQLVSRFKSLKPRLRTFAPAKTTRRLDRDRRAPSPKTASVF